MPASSQEVVIPRHRIAAGSDACKPPPASRDGHIYVTFGDHGAREKKKQPTRYHRESIGLSHGNRCRVLTIVLVVPSPR